MRLFTFLHYFLFCSLVVFANNTDAESNGRVFTWVDDRGVVHSRGLKAEEDEIKAQTTKKSTTKLSERETNRLDLSDYIDADQLQSQGFIRPLPNNEADIQNHQSEKPSADFFIRLDETGRLRTESIANVQKQQQTLTVKKNLLPAVRLSNWVYGGGVSTGENFLLDALFSIRCCGSLAESQFEILRKQTERQLRFEDNTPKIKVGNKVYKLRGMRLDNHYPYNKTNGEQLVDRQRIQFKVYLSKENLLSLDVVLLDDEKHIVALAPRDYDRRLGDWRSRSWVEMNMSTQTLSKGQTYYLLLLVGMDSAESNEASHYNMVPEGEVSVAWY